MPTFLAILVIMMVILAPIGSQAASSHSRDEIESLKGFRGIHLVVDDLPAEAIRDGLTQESIQTAAEQILRSSGIPIVYSEEEVRKSLPTSSYLYIAVLTHRARSFEAYAVYVQVRFRQWVSLIGRHQPSIAATTWEDGYIGVAGTDGLKRTVEGVAVLMKRFANDFLEANPR